MEGRASAGIIDGFAEAGAPQAYEPADTEPVALSSREPTIRDIERAVDQGEPILVAARYLVDGRLGCGGMAMVFEARDLVDDRRVALKILAEHCMRRPQLLTRFVREAELNGRLEHPNVVELFEFGSSRSGVIYQVLERLEGEDLSETLSREGPLPWPRVRDLMLDLCAGLTAAHRAGIVHRDLKPSNCYRVVDDEGESICLLDFGIADSAEAVGERLTRDNHVVGTPEYMAPEQARAERVDHRADIYAAGIILGELLTGALPFAAKTPAAQLAAHIYEPPPSLRELAGGTLEFPRAFEGIYAKALSKDPNERYASAEELAADLRAIKARTWSLPSSRLHASTSLQPRSSWASFALITAVAFVVGLVGALAIAGEVDHPATSSSVDASESVGAAAVAQPQYQLEPREDSP